MLVKLSQLLGQFFLLGYELLLFFGRTFESCSKVEDLAAHQVDPKRGELADQVAVAASGIGLSLQRLELSTDFTEQILQPGQVRFSRLKPTFALLLPTTIFEHASGFFDDRAAVFRASVENGIDLALRNDDVLLATNTGIAQEILDVEEPTGHAVDFILAVTSAKEATGDRDLFEFDRHESGGVVERDRHLGSSERLHLGCPSKDDIVHLL